MMINSAFRLLPALLVLFAAACSEPEERPDTGEAPSSIDSGTGSVPATVEWSVTPTGVGPVRVGMSLGEAREALNGELVVVDSTGPCYYTRPGKGPGGISFMVTNGQIARVDVQGDSVATDAGARVGDTEERIRTLYQGRVEVQPHKYVQGNYLIVRPEAGEARIVFETDGAKVTRYRAGKLPEVEWVEECS